MAWEAWDRDAGRRDQRYNPPAVSPVPISNALRLDWLVGPAGPLLDTPGRVALASCPGRRDLGSTLRDDLERLVAQGIRVVVSLVDDREMEFYGAYGLRTAVREAGLRSIHFPMVDTQPPGDLFAARSLCTQLLGWLGEGEHTLIHCIGGWGRSGTVAASLLTHQSYDAASAIKLVRQARSPRCVESRAQESFVHSYAASQRDFERYYFLARTAELPGLLAGSAGARRLTPSRVALQALRTADELRAELALRLAGSAAAAPVLPAELTILSGELDMAVRRPRRGDAAAELPAVYPVDRAFAWRDGVWRAVAFGDLIS